MPKRKALTAQEQERFLLERHRSGQMLGSFAGFASLLYATSDIILHSESKEINQTSLESAFMPEYKPTRRELFDAIARQTLSSWSYDATNDYWVFKRPAAPFPFTMKLAAGWTSEDHGQYLHCKPPTAPVGMDIYTFGSYSFEKDAAKKNEEVRDAVALMIGQHFKKDVTVKDMKPVKVDGADALYFEAPAPRPGVTWRQWAFVKNGHAICIVSSLDNGSDLLPAVEEMVKSFKMNEK